MPRTRQDPHVEVARDGGDLDLVCALSLDPGADHVWPSAGRLSELLVLNEEMVEELTLEREGGPGASLLGIIGQHQ